MNVVFLCASTFGLKSLKCLLKITNIKIVGVITTPEKFVVKYDKGKKNNTITNNIYGELQEICSKNNIPLYIMAQKMNDEVLIRTLKKWMPDFILVVGWYHIIGDEILKIPGKGVAGLHASLLPKYRGGAPLVWALINGEKETGITFFYFDKGIDTGDIIASTKVKILFEDDIKTLYSKIESAGLELLDKYIPQIKDNTAPRVKQSISEDGRIYSQRNPEDGAVEWKLHPFEIYNFVRAQTKPYPGAFTFFNGIRTTIWKCRVYNFSYRGPAKHGTIIAKVSEKPDAGVLVYANDEKIQLLITSVEIESKELTGEKLYDYFQVGDIFTCIK